MLKQDQKKRSDYSNKHTLAQEVAITTGYSLMVKCGYVQSESSQVVKAVHGRLIPCRLKNQT